MMIFNLQPDLKKKDAVNDPWLNASVPWLNVIYVLYERTFRLKAQLNE